MQWLKVMASPDTLDGTATAELCTGTSVVLVDPTGTS